MATFPSLIPSEAPIAPGAWPTTPHKSLNGAEARIRHGSAQIGGRWSPSFVNITEADFLAILNHYRGQRSGFDSFGFNATTLAADRTPAGFAWLHAAPPRVVDQHEDCFTVQCEFRCEPRGLVVAPGKAWRTGATVFTPGSRSTGTTYGPSVAWATSSTVFTPGSRTGSSLVSLLLHMDGSNGSTTFTDSSSNAHAMTINDGAVAITTAHSKFGGASGEFAGDLRTPTSSAFTFNGEFTIELWARRTGSTGQFDTLVSASNELQLMIRPGGSDPGFFFNGSQFATGFALALDTWQHVAMVRSGSTVAAYVDGVNIGTTTSSATVTCDFLIFGDSSVNGRYFKGQIDEVLVDKGNARWTANFTPPTAPYPDT